MPEYDDNYWKEYWRTSISEMPIANEKRKEQEMKQGESTIRDEIIRDVVPDLKNAVITNDIQEEVLRRCLEAEIETTKFGIAFRINTLRKEARSNGAGSGSTRPKPTPTKRQAKPAAAPHKSKHKLTLSELLGMVDARITRILEENEKLREFQNTVLEAAKR